MKIRTVLEFEDEFKDCTIETRNTNAGYVYIGNKHEVYHVTPTGKGYLSHLDGVPVRTRGESYIDVTKVEWVARLLEANRDEIARAQGHVLDLNTFRFLLGNKIAA